MAPEPDPGAAVPTHDAPSAEAPTAPPVVAVLVARDPGPWFDESLEALAGQDYPELAVLVIDPASDEPVAERVGRHLPDAYVRRLESNPGYGAAANEVLDVVEGAPFFLFLHDDVAMNSDTVRLLVEEAYRSNAGIVGPKQVAWNDQTRLLGVGLTVDRTGVAAGLADRFELDQEQHDAVRDVFAVPGGCMLMRSDLFSALGGFDPAIEYLGEDVDLCWRAQVVGARCVVAPDAVARHLEALSDRRPVDDRRRLMARHRLRTVLKAYGVLHLLRVLPVVAVVAGFEVVLALLIGRWAHARDVTSAWTWNLRNRSSLLKQRRALQRARRIPDAEVRRLQMRGSARVRGFLRGQLGVDERARIMTAAGRELGATLASRRARLVVVSVSAAVLLLLVGSRDLFTGDLPAVGGFQEVLSPGRLLSSWWNGWRDVGLGTDAPPPTGLLLYSAAGLLALGANEILPDLLAVLALSLGLVGAFALGRRLESVAAAGATTVAYAAIPLGYNAVAGGSWAGLVAWAVAPWIVRRLAQATDEAPFQGTSTRIVPFGIGLALAAAIVPFAVVLPLIVAVGFLAGSLVGGGLKGSARSLGVAAAAGVVAIVLHVPWTLDFLPPGAEWAPFGGVSGGGDGTALTDLLRFTTGPVGFDLLGWAVLVAGFLPLFVVRDWRLRWAARAWGGVLAAVGLAWAGEQGWLPMGLPDLEVTLAPAAACLALAVGCGTLAVERELAAYRFGWRQAVTVLAGAALVVSLIPILPAAASGRWRAPGAGVEATLGFIDEEAGPDKPGFRVMWIGHPEVLPVGANELIDGVGYGTSVNGLPDVTDRWPSSGSGPSGLLGDSVRVALAGDTADLGRLFAPLGVRYLVAMEQAAPGRGGAVRPLPAGLTSALGQQVDLKAIEVGPGVIVYENAAWKGSVMRLPAGADSALDVGRLDGALAPAAREVFDAAVPVPVDRHSPHDVTGSLDEAGPVLVGRAADDDWSMEVSGDEAPGRRVLGTVDLYQPSVSGEMALRHEPGPERFAGAALQVLLWILALGLARRGRQTRRAAA